MVAVLVEIAREGAKHLLNIYGVGEAVEDSVAAAHRTWSPTLVLEMLQTFD